MILRGVARRCPWCGGRGAFFVGYFTKAEHCQSCGLRWRRGDVGFELGAVTMAMIIIFGPLAILLGVMVAVTWPEVHTGRMYIVLCGLGGILPVVMYSRSYILWQAVDIVMRPPIPDDFEIVGSVTLEPNDVG